MSRKKRTYKQKRDSTTQIGLVLDNGNICCSGYTSLDRNPEIMTACRKIASLIGSATIHLMSNTEQGDVRIIHELSRAIDIEPMPNMTRSTWMEAIIMNLLLYGQGNSVVVPHTWNGLLQSLEPISASRVSFLPVGYRDYKVLIDGKERNPQSVLHFVYNPDPIYMWKGRGVHVSLRDIADNLKQATHTEKAFMSSEYKPSIIVKIDALTDVLALLEASTDFPEEIEEEAAADDVRRRLMQVVDEPGGTMVM